MAEKENHRTVEVKPGTSLVKLRLMATVPRGIGSSELTPPGPSLGTESAIEQVAELSAGEQAAAADIMFGPIQ